MELQDELRKALDAVFSGNEEQIVADWDTLLCAYIMLAAAMGISRAEVLTSLAAQLVTVAMEEDWDDMRIE